MIRRLIKSLIILLLIVGCENFLQWNEGICVLKDITIPNTILCFPQLTESTCHSDTLNSNITFITWSKNQNCDEFCNSVIDKECEIH